jgi:hypothetical protein
MKTFTEPIQGTGLHRSPWRIDEPEDGDDRDCKIDDGTGVMRIRIVAARN